MHDDAHDAHDRARSIDRLLAGDAAADEERRLGEHLEVCAECRRSLELGQAAVARLAAIPCPTEPASAARMKAALARRSRQLAAARRERRKAALGLAAALALTVAGSAAAWWCAAWLAALRHLPSLPLVVAVGLFWALPSAGAAVILLASSLGGVSPHGEETTT